MKAGRSNRRLFVIAATFVVTVLVGLRNLLQDSVKSPYYPSTSTQVVVARYDEDLSWLHSLDSSKHSILVYNKGPRLFSNDLPVGATVRTLHNVPNGRETHTMLYHILSNYDALPEWTVFTQGEPTIHSPAFVEHVNDAAFFSSPTPGFQCLSCGYRPKLSLGRCPGGRLGCGLRGLGGCPMSRNRPVTYKIDGKTLQLVGRPLNDKTLTNTIRWSEEEYGIPKFTSASYFFESFGLSKDRPFLVDDADGKDNTMDFCFAAMFAVHRDNIRQYSKRTYERMMEYYFVEPHPRGTSPEQWNCDDEDDCKAYEHAGFVMERLWMVLFTK
mmetsp:Transcript_5133/g.11156  ORF Transcript_5133/g.11156 Transcript_5133/m.11156 type:complete len:327 (+) Transcript_5133:74-1054(+)